MLTIVTVARTERIALLVDGRFVGLYGPGRHYVFTGFRMVERVVYPLSGEPQLIVPGDPLPSGVGGVTDFVVETHERGLAYVGGVFASVLGSGRYRHFDAVGGLRLVRVDLREEPLALDDADVLPAGLPGVTEVSATPTQALVLTRLLQPVRALPPGRYRFFVGGAFGVRAVPLSLHTLEAAAQDLLTRDHVPVRIKPAVTYRYADPVLAVGETDHQNQLYGAVHAALRDVVAARDLDTLLSDRDALGAELLAGTRARLAAVGLAVESAIVRDIVLAGEVKDLFNRVTLARKEAEALSIKRREEVAATRQLANTAKLLAESPILLRLKELEHLAEIASNVERLTIVGDRGLVAGLFGEER